ncbi:MAG: type II secretion system F family protein [Solirubrobacteraceae bacterium]|nr:type II secretion system F family protein [Solirubrobacteraceae bacterium]
MTATVALAAGAGALGGAGVGLLVPVVVDAGLRWRRRLATGGPAWVADGGRVRIVPASVVVGVVVLLAGAPLPGALVAIGPWGLRQVGRARADRRRRAVALGAPLVARAIADGLDAGLSTRGAIVDASRAAGVTGPPADELRRVAARLRAGDPLATSLAAWRAGTAEPAHATIVAALLLHGEAGGELGAVLRDQADALERARRSTAEADGATVQARSAARIVGGIPALGMAAAVLVAPGAVRALLANPLSVLLLAGAVVLQVAALVLVRRLTAELVR